MSRRCFPYTYPKRCPLSHDVYRPPPVKPLPFIGLTQACTLIRKEFRPIWLSTHCFPPYTLGGYFKAFFPLPPRVPQADHEVAQRRMGCYHNPAGTLKILATDAWPVVTDMLPLLKFRLRFPLYSLVPGSKYSNTSAEYLHAMSTLIKNTNPMWIRYIKQHVITQVLLRGSERTTGTDPLRIVIKERHAPDWMKASMGHNPRDIDDYAARLGLGDIGCTIAFGVDYS